MMTFTNEDLKRLKECSELSSRELTHKEIKALLARLEAAEYALLRLQITSHMWTKGIEEAVEAWRKSKGEK